MNNKGSTIKVPAIPVVVKKGSTLTLLQRNLPNNDFLTKCIKLSAVTKDQVIYKSVPGDFLRGEFPDLTLISRLNIFNQTSSTIAKFVNNDGSGTIIEKNSHEVVKVIGQNNYDTVFSALCSVISQELRIRALLALLTTEANNNGKEVSVQTEKSFADSASQTDVTSMNALDNFKQRRRIRRQQFRPYIVKEDNKKLKRVVIDPRSLIPNTPSSTQNNRCISKDNKIPSNSTDAVTCVPKNEIKGTEHESFPELSEIVNEDSNFSDISLGNISLTSQHSVNLPQLLENPTSLLDNIDQHTEDLNIVPLALLDGSIIMVCAKPMDKFHWATPDILKHLSCTDQNKLMYQQAFIHWKYCLERDEDGYLPIHQAVMSNDIEFLIRQCAALKKKYGSVDVPAAGNMTALQMSIYKDGERCAAVLLQNGADPYTQDDEGKNFFHTAAEVSHQHLKIALDHCKSYARVMLKEDEDLWNPVMEDKSDEQLAKILLDHICIMCDNQGYTPLMLASRQGNHSSVRLLLEASPYTVNRPMPNCGSTALYLAVEAACIEASNSNNQTKVSDSFLKTIELLMESGGDPGLENHFGSSVNILLSEFNIVDLSVLIANKLTSVKYFDGNNFAVSNINSLMLVKNDDGKVDLTEIRSRKVKNDFKDATKASTIINAKAGNKSKDFNSKININKDKRKNSTSKVNKNKNKSSNVEIKEIKTIKPKKMDAALAAHSASDPKFVAPVAVNVKPSNFIIVPKNSQPKADVPKFVKILPKLDNQAVGETSKGFTMVVGGSGELNVNAAVNLKQKTASNRKHKKNAESEQTPHKKQRKETKNSQKTNQNEASKKLHEQDTSRHVVEVKEELVVITE